MMIDRMNKEGKARWLFTVALVSAAFSFANAEDGVNGRYVRVEAPTSLRMGLYEIEVYSDGKNIVLKNPEVDVSGVAFRGMDLKHRGKDRSLIDGVANLEERSIRCDSTTGLDPWVEIDLGKEMPIDRIVVKSGTQQWRDRLLRLVTVLDGERKILWARRYRIDQPPFKDQIAEFKVGDYNKNLAGKTMPPPGTQLLPLSDILEIQPAIKGAGAEVREERFDERNSPAAIEQLARDFFTRMDLTKPELVNVQKLFNKEDYRGALDAYRDYFLKKLRATPLITVWGEPFEISPPQNRLAAEDLRRGMTVNISRGVATPFVPGQIDWTIADRPVGTMQYPLLYEYVQTGKPEYVEQWAKISDDWGMNLRDTLDQAASEGQDLRNYFVKNNLQQFNHFAARLKVAATKRSEFADLLPGPTLARLLIPVLEEYPPAYWWVCRRTVFNHTFNAMGAATVTSRILDDFHAGQRLDRENRQQWERVWSMMMTRDGCMQEIADEGHMFMQWRMAAFVDYMKRVRTPWLTDYFLREFKTGWHKTAVYPLRHLAPDGYGHRLGTLNYDYFNKFWWLAEPSQEVRELGSNPELDNSEILRQPEVAGILQAVFGVGRDFDRLDGERRKYWQQVTDYYGHALTPPVTVSDWMPYAGLWYLRRSWEPDATYVHMLCQPKAHPSSNGSAWNTEVHYFDYGAPLLALSPVWIDGKPPFPKDIQTYKPGSKTERLTTASQNPIPARWHTSEFLDYAESFYEGTYQKHREQRGGGLTPNRPILGENPVHNARADRRVIMFRPARLLIVTDAVRVPASDGLRHYDIRQRFATPNGSTVPGTFHGDARTLSLANEDAPGVTVRRFTSADLSWNPRNTPDPWTGKELGGPGGAAMINHTGVLENRGGILKAETDGDLLMSALIEPHRRRGDVTVRQTTDLSAEGVTGFRATLTEGSTLTWLATRGENRTLNAARIEAHAEALLVYQTRTGEDGENQLQGIVLGCSALAINGKPVKTSTPDFEFTMDATSGKNGRGFLAPRPSPSSLALTLTPIHRPIKPVTFSPQESAFTDTRQVTMSSGTPGLDIRYTLDGSEPNSSSPLYTEPVTIEADTYIRARAFRPDVHQIPFTAAGTDVSVVSGARFHKRDLKPAVDAPADAAPGLHWELVNDSWRRLFSYLHLPEVMPADAEGGTDQLLDVSMRQGDGPFGVRYSGFLEIPAAGVWTFHAPPEYVGASCEPGYDLRLWIDGEQWDLGQRFHGRGIWSVPLKAGLHEMVVTFADARHRDGTVHNPNLWGGYPSPWVVWKGEAPVIEISGPGVTKQPVPAEWMRK